MAQIVDDDKDLYEVYADDIDMGINQFCDNNDIDLRDLRSMPQSVWSACMIYIHKHVLNDPLLLKSNPNINNAYNFDKVNKLYDAYIYYSSLYNKVVSMFDFSNLSGISQSIICEWGLNLDTFHDGSRSLSDKGSEFAKRLKKSREEALTNRIISTGNAVGLLGVANREYGWNQPGTASAAIGYRPAPREHLPDSDIKPPELPEIPHNLTNSGD